VNMRHAEQPQGREQISAGDTPNGKLKVSSRRKIAGLTAYEISADGTPRKWGRRLPIHKGLGGLPVIDVNGVERLLDEVVARAFLGPPPCDLRGVTVVHFDNNPLNCAVDNIAWRIDREWLESRVERQVQARMRQDNRRPTKQRMHFFT
jgi:hypothetical protein